MFGSFDKIGRQYGWQPQLPKGEITYSEITKYDYNLMRHVWEPYLEPDVLCSSIVYARHSLEMQKVTKNGIQEAWTEADLGRKG